jgi:aspartyl-tRNA synthetase
MASIARRTASALLTGANGEALKTGLRTHSCNQLRTQHIGETVKLCGWVQIARDKNHFVFVDLRDRYGITQIVFHNPGEDGSLQAANYAAAKALGRESCITVEGVVVERSNKNENRDTGEVEVNAVSLAVLNPSKTPPFLVQDETDGKLRSIASVASSDYLSSFAMSFTDLI